jgi:hypothetical protein
VLVDRNGTMKALPRLIDDKKVRIEHVRKFLAKDFPKDSLPDADQARALAAGHRAAMQLFEKNEQRIVREAREKQQREDLVRRQQPRRQKLQQEENALDERQRLARHDFALRQWGERAALRQGYLHENRRIRIERETNRPKGLAAFLGRISGVELITRKYQQYRDAKRYQEFLAQKRALAERQKREEQEKQRAQELEKLTMQRRLHGLEQVEKREMRSLETALLKDRRIEDRERSGGEQPAHERDSHTDVFNRAAEQPIDLTEEFERAAGSSGGEEESGEAGTEPAPDGEPTIHRRKRTRERSQDMDSGRSRSGRRRDDTRSEDTTPRRRRDRDFDRDR